MRSIGIGLAFSIGLFLASCEKPASDPKLPPVNPPANPAKSAADSSLGDIKKATSSASETAKEIAATAKDQVADAAAAIDSAMTPEKLKSAVASLTPEKLKEIADKIVAAIQEKTTSLKGLQEKFGALGAGDEAKGPEIKKDLDSTTSLIAQLKEKLKVVVEQLKAKGIDISKYT